MRTRAFVLAAFLSATVTLSAQENEKIKYSNITEFGMITASPMGIGGEGTTVQGIAIDKQHLLGLGVGIGLNSHFHYLAAYMPIFVNYRYYFNPNKTFSPHVNASLGGLIVEDGGGIYSSLTAGFKAGYFSFSSGLSFMAVNEKMYGWDYYRPKSYGYWSFPFGITLKCGFTF